MRRSFQPLPLPQHDHFYSLLPTGANDCEVSVNLCWLNHQVPKLFEMFVGHLKCYIETI